MSDWVRLGEVVKTQVHAAKVVFDGRYHADLICGTEALSLSPAGVVGVTGAAAVLDYHHRDHPDLGRFLPGRQLSVGFTGHYQAMQERFGAAPVGIAAENIVVDHPGRVLPADVADGLLIDSADGSCELAAAAVARPCVPFTKYLLGDPEADDVAVAENRAFLDEGMRGYVMALVGLEGRFRVAPGDTVYRRA